MTNCCPSRGDSSPIAATLRRPPVVASTSISMDSLRSRRSRADKPAVTAGSRVRSASLGTHANPNAAQIDDRVHPLVGELGHLEWPIGPQVEGRIGQYHRGLSRNAERVDH